MRAALLDLMVQIDVRDMVNVYHDGVVELLDQPEFAQRERARAIVEVLERPHALRELLPEVPEAEGVQILIGTENRWDWMRECAVVLTRYGEVGALTGVVGVVGPLRLPYYVAVPAVRYVSHIMTELRNSGAATPTIVKDLSARRIRRPITELSPPNRRCQNECVMTAMGSMPTRRDSSRA